MKKSYQAAFQAATEKADAARALAQQIEIMDVDRTFPADGFTVEYATDSYFEETGKIAVSHSDFGDWLVAAKQADGFDGERLIWYGCPDWKHDPRTGELREYPGRHSTQPIAEYIRHDLTDSILAAYIAELLTQKTAH